MTRVIFQREILINAPATHVWQLVATENGLRQWWGNTIYLEAKEGGRCEEWRPERDKTAHWQGVVTQYTPPHQLMLTLRAQEQQADGPELTTISIALEAKGDQTRVHVTQRAFASAPAISPRASTPQPDPQGVPMSQLHQPAPGTIPMPAPLPQPTMGHAAPSDALTQTWQRRLSSLAAAFQADAQP